MHNRLIVSLGFILALLLVGCTVPVAPAAPVSEAGSTDATAVQPEVAESDAVSSETNDVDVSLFPLTIADAAGQEFTFKEPARIGCLWYGCTEAMADLGIPMYASIISEEEAQTAFYAPAGPPTHLIEDWQNPELWAAVEADVILTRVPVSPENDALEAAAPVFYLHHPSYGESNETGYQAYIENLQLLGQLSGNPEAADAAIARFETLKENLAALATEETADQTVAVLFSGEGFRGLSVDNPFCVLLAEAGLGQCPEAGEDEAWLDMNAEQFLALDPDWIVYQTFGEESYEDREDPVWSELTAVKEGRVFDTVSNRYYCCSTRGLIHAFQDYVSNVLPDAGIPNPGPQLEFDANESPLVQTE